jgi:hypothetical protein
MKKYKYFLLEKLIDKVDSHLTELTEDDFNDMKAYYCKDFHDSDKPIYKGMNYRDMPKSIKSHLYFNPITKRKSANTKNYFTLLFDNSPYLGEFPKRSESLICTSNYEQANAYAVHRPHRVIPFDDAKIAICPRQDIWFSFRETVGDIDNFNETIHTNYHRMLDKNNMVSNELNDNDFNIFIEQLEKICEFDDNENFYRFETFPKSVDEFFKLLNPYKNGFVIMPYNEYKSLPLEKYPNREIFTDSKCLLKITK